MLRRLPHLILMLTLLNVSAWAKKDAGVSIEPEPEQWKGKPYDSQIQLGGMAGMSVVGASLGFTVLATGAFKIIHQGFLDDVNDQVHIELAAGPLFLAGSVGLMYGAHMRWDFHKNDIWSFYALGGFGGIIIGPSLARTFEFYPRFGIGALWNLFDTISFRAELSHEFTGLGIVFLI